MYRVSDKIHQRSYHSHKEFHEIPKAKYHILGRIIHIDPPYLSQQYHMLLFENWRPRFPAPTKSCKNHVPLFFSIKFVMPIFFLEMYYCF